HETKMDFYLGYSFAQLNYPKEALPYLHKFHESKDAKRESHQQLTRYAIIVIELSVGDAATAASFAKAYIKDYGKDADLSAKLIQAYVKSEDYSKAKEIRDQLYDDHAKKLLPSYQNEKFRFDEFIWNGTTVVAEERFQRGVSTNKYRKHSFYVLKEDGSVDFSLHTEFLPAKASGAANKYYF